MLRPIAAAFLPYVPGILQFVTNTADDEEASFDYLRTCYNLVGDIASTYKGQLKDTLLDPSMSHFLQISKNKGCKQRATNQASKYARQVGRRICSNHT